LPLLLERDGVWPSEGLLPPCHQRPFATDADDRHILQPQLDEFVSDVSLVLPHLLRHSSARARERSPWRQAPSAVSAVQDGNRRFAERSNPLGNLLELGLLLALRIKAEQDHIGDLNCTSRMTFEY
jgi:hypothetical protein